MKLFLSIRGCREKDALELNPVLDWFQGSSAEIVAHEQQALTINSNASTHG